MGIIAQNKISSLGMLFGAIALMMGIIHFSFGPFSAPPPTFESIVADKTAEIKRGLLAGIKGEKITTVEKKEDVDVDKILDQSGIALAIAALLCAFIGGMRKENRWGIRGALVFGGGTLAFHTLLFGIGIVCSILLIFLIFSFLTGGWDVKAAIVMSLINFFLFFGPDLIKRIRQDSKYWRTRAQFRRNNRH